MFFPPQDSESLPWTKPNQTNKQKHIVLLLTCLLSCILGLTYRTSLGHHHIPAYFFTPAIAAAASNQMCKLLIAPSSLAILMHGQNWKGVDSSRKT